MNIVYIYKVAGPKELRDYADEKHDELTKMSTDVLQNGKICEAVGRIYQAHSQKLTHIERKYLSSLHMQMKKDGCDLAGAERQQLLALQDQQKHI